MKHEKCICIVLNQTNQNKTTTTKCNSIASFKKFKESVIFRQQAEVSFANSSSQDGVARAGEKALVIIYNGKPADTLDSL